MFTNEDFKRLLVKQTSQRIPMEKASNILRQEQGSVQPILWISEDGRHLVDIPQTATFHAKGISRLKHLKAFFHELLKGRTDYQKLIPAVLRMS